ncbi:MAG TPA: 2-amino-4-hydroxy-6-hydroxymethyldihydropteridine diphosphokinase [Candidatus Saccharimonadales bacterium]|nr:2-amino-4-hydroxy-6-hydroxymethyldihydropteridine diphosphokinase [Candidatus Saccharimonadales bacterium]
MVTVYLALGSNVGDSARYITKAIDLLGSALQDIQQAPLYVSKAVGYTDQADFLNTAISGQTELSPQALSRVIKNTERQIGRVKRFRWGPREIDIDIIFYGNQVLATDSLTIPHPSFKQRDFVLRPIVDLNSKMIDPLTHKTVKQLLNQQDPSHLSIIRKV